MIFEYFSIDNLFSESFFSVNVRIRIAAMSYLFVKQMHYGRPYPSLTEVQLTSSDTVPWR